MSLRRLSAGLVFVAVLLGNHERLSAQDSVVSEYEELLNRVFPWPPKGPDPLVISMRFESSFTLVPESQIIIKFSDKGAIAEQLQAQVLLQEVMRTAPDLDDTAALVKAARIERKVKNYDLKAAQEWTRTFWTALAQSTPVIKKKVGILMLDGATYDLRLDTGLATVTLLIRDGVLEDHVTGDMPVVR